MNVQVLYNTDDVRLTEPLQAYHEGPDYIVCIYSNILLLAEFPFDDRRPIFRTVLSPEFHNSSFFCGVLDS